jgi:hypothetical protein
MRTSNNVWTDWPSDAQIMRWADEFWVALGVVEKGELLSRPARERRSSDVRNSPKTLESIKRAGLKDERLRKKKEVQSHASLRHRTRGLNHFLYPHKV